MARLEYPEPHNEIGSLLALHGSAGRANYETEVGNWIVRLPEADRTAIFRLCEGTNDSLNIHAFLRYLYALASQNTDYYRRIFHGTYQHFFQGPGAVGPLARQPVNPLFGIFFCIQREHQETGKEGDWLNESTARDFIGFLLDSSAPDETPRADAAELTRMTLRGALGRFPFLRRLASEKTLTAEAVREVFENQPADRIVAFLSYLRNQITVERHHALPHGIMFSDIRETQNLIRVLEDLAKEKLSGEILQRDGWRNIPQLVEENIHSPVRDPGRWIQALQRLPETRRQDEGRRQEQVRNIIHSVRSAIEVIGGIGGAIAGFLHLRGERAAAAAQTSRTTPGGTNNTHPAAGAAEHPTPATGQRPHP